MLAGVWRGRGRAASWQDLALSGPLWAVGDVHGRLDLVQRAEALIRAETPQATVVYLGDLIDRGPDSRGVIDQLLRQDPDLTRRAVLGNHEDMALRFLADPAGGAAWLAHGGGAALASYGIEPGPGEAPADLAARWAGRLPVAHRAFLAGLPLGIMAGRHVLTHAGAAAEVALRRQGKAELVWQRHAEIDDLRPPVDLGARIVVHGHVPQAAPRASGWRINLDTGAWHSGRLGLARLFPDGRADLRVVT